MTARRFLFATLVFTLSALLALETGRAQEKKDEKTYGSLVFWVVIGNGVCG